MLSPQIRNLSQDFGLDDEEVPNFMMKCEVVSNFQCDFLFRILFNLLIEFQADYEYSTYDSASKTYNKIDFAVHSNENDEALNDPSSIKTGAQLVLNQILNSERVTNPKESKKRVAEAERPSEQALDIHRHQNVCILLSQAGITTISSVLRSLLNEE